MSHRLLPHTADLRAEVTARDWPALLASGIDLVREILVGDSPVALRRQRRIVLPSADDGERFFRFLRELVYLYDSEGFLARQLISLQPPQVGGETFDPGRHHSEHPLKAVTRHGYRLEHAPDGYRVEVIFDL